jgi:hypothetical protein
MYSLLLFVLYDVLTCFTPCEINAGNPNHPEEIPAMNTNNPMTAVQTTTVLVSFML